MDPFAHLAPALVRLGEPEAREWVNTVEPLDLYAVANEGPLRVRDLTAIRCEAYARVLHPVRVEIERERMGADWFWSQLGGDSKLDPNVRLADLLATASLTLQNRGLRAEPLPGVLGHLPASTLARAIDKRGAGQDCSFYFWEGLGWLRGGAPYVYRANVLLVTGLYAFGSSGFAAPTLWAGRNQDWFVASHTDATSTYMGGSEGLVQDLLGTRVVEILPATLDSEVDTWPAFPGSRSQGLPS
jgi:hypothetical protein